MNDVGMTIYVISFLNSKLYAI